MGLESRVSKNDKLQKWGVKRGSIKKEVWLTTNTKDWVINCLKIPQKKSQKYDSSVIILQKKRRIDGGLGSMRDFKVEWSNVKLTGGKNEEICSNKSERVTFDGLQI